MQFPLLGSGHLFDQLLFESGVWTSDSGRRMRCRISIANSGERDATMWSNIVFWEVIIRVANYTLEQTTPPGQLAKMVAV